MTTRDFYVAVGFDRDGDFRSCVHCYRPSETGPVEHAAAWLTDEFGLGPYTDCRWLKVVYPAVCDAAPAVVTVDLTKETE